MFKLTYMGSAIGTCQRLFVVTLSRVKEKNNNPACIRNIKALM
jgi:hypothetical protein